MKRWVFLHENGEDWHVVGTDSCLAICDDAEIRDAQAEGRQPKGARQVRVCKLLNPADMSGFQDEPNRYTLAELEALPTLHSGHWDNLKVETGDTRVWLSRCGLADGAPYDNGVTVERLIAGEWVTVDEYQAR